MGVYQGGATLVSAEIQTPLIGLFLQWMSTEDKTDLLGAKQEHPEEANINLPCAVPVSALLAASLCSPVVSLVSVLSSWQS